jgi:tetratricopeptide (TPR) repeat protein
MEAYDFYLRGKNLANRENRADIDSAIAALKHAISLDPTFSAAYAQLARAYNVKAAFIAAGETQWGVLASAALDKALALDSSLAEAHLVRGLMLWTQSYGFPHEETIKEFRRAVLLDPTMDEAHHQLGTVYIHLGMWEKCLAELNQALSLNPANTMARFRIGVLHSYRQEYGEALRQVEAIPKEFNPALLGYHVSWSLFHLNRRLEAQVKLTEYINVAARDEGGILSAMQALLFASTGDTIQANQKIGLAIQTSQGYKHFHHTAFIIGCCFALMHDQHESVEWLRRAADDGFPCYPVFDQEPTLKNLIQNSEFQSFMEDLRRRWEHFKETA